MTRFIYLHGFASSPSSTKAVFFGERLTRLGHAVDVPDLEEGDFEGLTITRQLAVVRRAIARAPGELALIGSSMGGYLALLAAAEEPRLYDDLGRYDPAPPARVPTLTFMGRRDDTVAPAACFPSSRPGTCRAVGRGAGRAASSP